MTAALYDVDVRHTRFERVRRSFRHKVYLWLVDVDDLPRLPWWLRPFARFAARDHIGDPGASIGANVRAWLAERGQPRPDRVLMLANARVLGHVFNPLTLYWALDARDAVRCVVAEVHNTYGERHAYLLHPDAHGRARTEKVFYVSPFLSVDGEYLMRLPRPGDTLSVTVTLTRDGTTPFTATLTGRRVAASPTEVVRMIARRPLVTLRVSALIRRHGVALWLRRVPVVPRGAHEQEVGR